MSQTMLEDPCLPLLKTNSNGEPKQKLAHTAHDAMTSSLVSVTSSLSSPVDSGVQLLDSESDLTSDTDNDIKVAAVRVRADFLTSTSTGAVEEPGDFSKPAVLKADGAVEGQSEAERSKELLLVVGGNTHVMTKSDIANQNVTTPVDLRGFSSSAPARDFLQSYQEVENGSFDARNDAGNSSIRPEAGEGLNAEVFSNLKQDIMNNLSQKMEEKINEMIKSYTSAEVHDDGAMNENFNFQHLTQTLPDADYGLKSSSNAEEDVDLMTVSLNSYELLDYTLQNIESCALGESEMHVSLSEEVNESLLRSSQEVALSSPTPTPIPTKPLVEEVKVVGDEQIVFRRQRKKKSRSDTPKKRVSFHEDILNSTKIDDIHIERGFITHEPDLYAGFFRKPDVVKGRYSWAAEGDASYHYDCDYNTQNQREVKSDMFVRFSSTSTSTSTSSSSNASISSSSVDEEDETQPKPVVATKPKSSCLKKKPKKKCIKTDIVEEEATTNSARKRRSESNLLDSNLLGSLKSILSFSTSVPLAERGVPEGQEDLTLYSCSHESNFSTTSNPNLRVKAIEVLTEPVRVVAKKLDPLEQAKGSLKLTKSEGFYPNYPMPSNVPANIIICDSNVYEHKGISYSYEYDNFQKSFQEPKPKSSTLYQKILKEFNFFKRKANQDQAQEQPQQQQQQQPLTNDFEILDDNSISDKTSTLSKCASTTRMDWSDNDTTTSDYPETGNSRHLNSPKRRINKPNHYSVQQSFKSDFLDSASRSNLRVSSSKTSLINRFLRNVTMKKIIDMRIQKKQKAPRKYLSLYVRNQTVGAEVNRDIDRMIEEEVVKGRQGSERDVHKYDANLLKKLQVQVFRDGKEQLLKAFPVSSAYTTIGDNKPLMLLLTDSTMYVSSSRTSSAYSTHFALPYVDLNTILIGPSAQTVHFSNHDKDLQFLVATGCANITGEIVSQLEMAMRRDRNKPRLPAVKQLNMRDMANLRRAICKQTAVENDEEYFHYSIVNCQEHNAETGDTPLGPNKEGPLMFKVMENDSRWETSYFILKAGVLYMLSSPTHRVPMRVLPLVNGACQGAKRVPSCPRPHTFQLTIGSTVLHLAAPDEYVASDWLQALVQAASGTYNQRERVMAPSCSLLMTSEHILTVREAFPCALSFPGAHNPIKGAQALSCAAICDLTAFRLPSAEHSWCVLEFACREVHETSGDWILYFCTNAELENFISTLEMLWDYNNELGDSFPLSTIPETDPLSKRCSETYRQLQEAWPHLLMTPQFF